MNKVKQLNIKESIWIGIISDTHGLLRPEAVNALQASQLILHAGDIGKPDVLSQLAEIAPVIAVRGNNDAGDWAKAIPERETIQAGAVVIHLLHILQEFNRQELNVEAASQVVVTGHSHKPLITTQDGILFVNPGSAGPRRFKLPVSIAQLQINGANAEAKIVELL